MEDVVTADNRKPGRLLEPPQWLALAALALVLIGGAWIRLQGLEARGIGHIEIFVPNLPLPEGLSTDPRPRLTLAATLRGTMWEPHPPAWYLLMWAWTKLAGTSLFAIRLPSVLFGLGAIVGVYWLGVLAAGRLPGLLGAALLAFNGHNALWSQIARPALLGAFLGLVSTVMLIQVMRQRGPRRTLALGLYLASTLAGLTTLYYFWLLFAAQILAVALITVAAGKAKISLLRNQLLLLLLASPLVSLAIFQSKPSYLESSPAGIIADYARFGFLFEPDPDLPIGAAPAPVVGLGLLVLSAGLLVLSLRSPKKTPLPSSRGELRAPSLAILALAAFASLVAMEAFAVVALNTVQGKADPLSTGIAGRATQFYLAGAIPILILLFSVVVIRTWPSILRLGRPLAGVPLFKDQPLLLLVLLFATVPVAIGFALNALLPFLASRHLIIFTPYLFLLLGCGAATVLNARPGWAGLGLFCAVAAVAIAASVASLGFHRQRPMSPNDYQGLVNKWEPLIQEDDLIFIQVHWATSPIFYYLPADRYHYVAWDYAQAIADAPDARVWLLTFEGLLTPQAAQQALAGHLEEQGLEALRIRASLYLPGVTATRLNTGQMVFH